MTPATLPLWRYGLLGAPLAFVSLPLYVTLPYHYAQQFGVSLAALGAVLLATRAADALVDPLIGRWVDTLFRRGSRRAWGAAAAGAALMSLGFAALWLPPAAGTAALAWLAVCLVLTYAAYSLVGVVHQAWGARWGGTPTQRARIVAAREGAALVGVVAASVLPLWAGQGSVSVVLAVALACGLAALYGTASPTPTQMPELRPSRSDIPPQAAAAPWADPSFRALIIVFVINGMASAIPATLLPFFVADVLQAQHAQPWLLALYFAAAAIGLPLWVRVVRRIGLAPAWRAGMLLAVAAFALTPTLGSGDVAAFALVCAASGLALGADLALPAALLVGVVRDAGQAESGEGRYFGWWTCASKLNLALAAGASLPLLALAGYQAGSQDDAALGALSLAYGGVPLLLKLVAAALLWRAEGRHHTFSRRSAA
jgi:GPH family glycoside/pentoside/hexuronide:cation symporter